ncbi:MAG: TPM domain-containing protein [Eubacteriales bacterium]|nr:TPM domain-containing protein [Eubacteriales bacterium]
MKAEKKRRSLRSILLILGFSLILAATMSGPARAAAAEAGAAADGAQTGEEGNPEGAQAGENEGTDSAQTGEPLWSEEFYRAVDTSGGLSPAEQQSLDKTCLEFMQTYHTDLSLLAVTSDRYAGATLEDLADSYYTGSGFGYGEGKDGFQMVWDTQTDEVLIRAYGAAQDMIPPTYLKHVEESVVSFKEKYNVYGPLYATSRYLSNYLRGAGEATKQEGEAFVSGTGTASDDFNSDAAARSEQPDAAEGDGAGAAEADAAGSGGAGSADAAGSEGAGGAAQAGEGTEGTGEGTPSDVSGAQQTKDGSDVSGEGGRTLSDRERMLPDGQMPDEALRVGEGSGMPSWYPKDPASFPFYHDENAPRIVDLADIFTAEEEARMEARLAELRPLLGRDIVVFTDNTTYGLSRSVYAADFYDFNGYGIGEDREGCCLMISMESGNRGWWCCCTGPDTRGLYTETVANQIDDMLYEYMVDGDYGTGVADWIENFRRLYTTGSPYSEEWALMDKSSFTRFHDESAPRVVDDAMILTQSEIESLTAKAASISEKYGIDVVIHTARNQGILDRDEYGDKYFTFNGYGYGDDYDGILLTIFKRPNYSGGARVYASGKALNKLTAVNKERLENRCEDVVLHREYADAADQWLDQAEHMLRTGRAPRSSGSWEFVTVIELLAGLIFGGVSLSGAKRKMATPAIRENANAYVVKNSISIRRIADHLIDVASSRTYSPVRRESSGGGGSSSGGGHSSYSSSYSGSSGSSHSGSGRTF